MLHPSTFARLAGLSDHHAPPHHPGAADDAALLIRPASPADDRAIARLSALDEHELPTRGDRLVGELGGRIVAALDVRSGDAVADPFVPTSGLLELLGLRAAQVRR